MLAQASACASFPRLRKVSLMLAHACARFHFCLRKRPLVHACARFLWFFRFSGLPALCFSLVHSPEKPKQPPTSLKPCGRFRFSPKNPRSRKVSVMLAQASAHACARFLHLCLRKRELAQAHACASFLHLCWRKRPLVPAS